MFYSNLKAFVDFEQKDDKCFLNTYKVKHMTSECPWSEDRTFTQNLFTLVQFKVFEIVHEVYTIFLLGSRAFVIYIYRYM